MFTGYMYNRGYKLYLFICDLAQNPYKQLINSSISLTIFAKTWIQFSTVVDFIGETMLELLSS